MATSLINELFEEGLTRSRELTDAADEAMNAIDEMAKDAEQLAGRVETQAKEAGGHLRDLAARLARAEAEMETARRDSDGALEALAGRAAEAKSEAGDLLERVRKTMAELEARQQVLDGALDAQMDTAQQDFAELVQGTQRSQSQAEEDLQQAARRIAAFRTAVGEAREEFAAKQQAWTDALGELEAAVQQQADEWLGAVNGLLQRQSQALVEAGNTMVDEHNAAMDAVTERFVEQAPQDLARTLDRLEAALTAMGGAAAECEQRLSAEARQLEQRVAGALPSLPPIDAALEAAGKLA